MNPAILNSQFVQVALPVVLTIFIAARMNGRANSDRRNQVSRIASATSAGYCRM